MTGDNEIRQELLDAADDEVATHIVTTVLAAEVARVRAAAAALDTAVSAVRAQGAGQTVQHRAHGRDAHVTCRPQRNRLVAGRAVACPASPGGL